MNTTNTSLLNIYVHCNNVIVIVGDVLVKILLPPLQNIQIKSCFQIHLSLMMRANKISKLLLRFKSQYFHVLCRLRMPSLKNITDYELYRIKVETQNWITKIESDRGMHKWRTEMYVA